MPSEDFARAVRMSSEFRELGASMDFSATEFRCLAVIPARGGSERIRDKNIVDFFGKPLLGYSLELADAAGIFTRVHVSTDCERIASVARAFGHATDFARPSGLSDARTGVWSVVRSVLAEYSRRGEEFDYVCLLSACAPLLRREDLRGGMAYFLSYFRRGKCIQLMACCEYLASPLRALGFSETGMLEPLDASSFAESRSQDLRAYVMDTGAFAYRASSDLLSGEYVATNGEVAMSRLARAYILPRARAVDINEPSDLEFAKLLYRAQEIRE